MSRNDQRGAATVLVLATAGALTLLGAALAVVVAMVVAHRAAQSAADLAALAGAHEVALGRNGCTSAAAMAAANRARVISCSVAGHDIEIEVEVTGPHWLGQHADLTARSRAGPAP